MQWLLFYEKDLEEAFVEAEIILSNLPGNFRKLALDCLEKFHALKNQRSKNYICYLLPYWLKETAMASSADCHRFAVANIFGMLYYHLVDEVMDEPEAKNKYQLPLADLIHFEFMQQYSSYFTVTSPFWTYYRKYAAQWGDAVTQENLHDFFYEDTLRVAHKASPVKLTIAGLLLLAGREEDISVLEAAVDTVLVTLQMLDDWQDWEKDLHEGSYNCLIATVQSELNIPASRRPTAEEIRQAIFVSGILSSYKKYADKNHDALSAIRTLVPHLYEFHEFLLDNLNEASEQLVADRNLLQHGGLEFWLAKNTSIPGFST